MMVIALRIRTTCARAAGLSLLSYQLRKARRAMQGELFLQVTLSSLLCFSGVKEGTPKIESFDHFGIKI